MFRPMLHALPLRRLGFTRPFRILILLVLLGCIAAGLIYRMSKLKRSRKTSVLEMSTPL